MHRETVDLSAMARDLLAQLSASDPERASAFVVADGATTQGDARLLRIVLENLLGNAWKFTERQPVTRIDFGVTHERGTRVFYVKDNGVGFDPQYAGKLFTPFQRLHSGDDFQGNGIGLATVARVVDRHGGRVWARGEVGAGATFYFTCGEGRSATT
jgi:light-regulated signal transduction histidine kinase (bacteriophytochrome)